MYKIELYNFLHQLFILSQKEEGKVGLTVKNISLYFMYLFLFIFLYWIFLSLYINILIVFSIIKW